MTQTIKYLPFVLLMILLITACGEEGVIIPKPRAYPKVEFPEQAYQAFDEHFCSFTFQYPAYTEVIQDTSFFEEKPAHACWFDIFYPGFDARLHFTYAQANGTKGLNELKEDAFELVDWQNKKASYIQEIQISKAAQNVEGMAFDITGPAASPFQFYLTDGEKHFVRASLYFNTKINADSLAPMYDFVKADIAHLIESFEWRGGE